MLPALIGAGASLLGGIFGNNSAKKAAKSANKYALLQSREQMAFQEASNAKQMAFQEAQNQKAMDYSTQSNKTQMDYQTSMANTAHQREISDLRAAGLNPILSGMGGSGSAVPVGSSSSGVTSAGSSSSGSQGQVYKADVRDVIGPAVQSYLATALQTAQIAKLEAETQTEKWRPENVQSTTSLVKAQAATEAWGPEQRKWATELLGAQFNKTIAEKDAIYGWQRLLTEAQIYNSYERKIEKNR